MNIKDVEELPRLIDISAVRTDVTIEEVHQVVDIAKQFNFVCAFAMPCFTPILIEALKDEPDINVGGVIGFPSGADTTNVKITQANELLEMGCNELDMVINVGALKSGDYELVKKDIKAIVDTVNGRVPVKAILEIAYLTDEDIKIGARLAVEAGVTFVKTGTGWGPKPSTIETVKLIKEEIGDSAFLKVAGGVRTLDTVLEMQRLGCNRFGIGLNSVMNILKEAYGRANIEMPEVKNRLQSVNDNY